MNYLKYDYYGNYKDDTYKFNFSVNEIHKTQREREKRRLKIYETIAVRCLKHIKASALNEDVFCFFQMPEYIPGKPLYNMTECVLFIVNLLHDKGFSARYVDPFLIYISWSLPKPTLKLLEPPPKQEENSEVLNSLNLKYKPIETYKSRNDLLFRKL